MAGQCTRHKRPLPGTNAPLYRSGRGRGKAARWSRLSSVPDVSARRPRPLLAGLAAAAALVTLAAGCDADPVTRTSISGSTTTTAGPTTSSTDAPTSPAPGTSAETTPATSGPATPTAPPGTFAIAVAGAGQVTYPVTAVRCDATTVVGTATPPGGGPAGTVTLEAATGVVTVAGLAPLDGTRLTGTVSGTPAAGVEVRWTGDGTGSAASLSISCP